MGKISYNITQIGTDLKQTFKQTFKQPPINLDKIVVRSVVFIASLRVGGES